MQYSTVHCTVLYSTVQYSAVQCSTVQYIVQYSIVQYSAVQYSIIILVFSSYPDARAIPSNSKQAAKLNIESQFNSAIKSVN